MNVSDTIKNLLKDVGIPLTSDVGWDCHGTFVLLHETLERIAEKKKISFDPPELLHKETSPVNVAMVVVGRMIIQTHLGDIERTEWSIGECNESNLKVKNYPFAMAEKRAKDRVILKLCGISGEAYSSEEADDFSPMAELLKHNECAEQNIDVLHNIKECIANDENDHAIAAFRDLTEADQKTLWRAHTKGGMLTHNERKILKGI
jgi:hypothetical protein